jgi:hypothetical protein
MTRPPSKYQYRDKRGRPMRKCTCGKICWGKKCKACVMNTSGMKLTAIINSRRKRGILLSDW